MAYSEMLVVISVMCKRAFSFLHIADDYDTWNVTHNSTTKRTSSANDETRWVTAC